MVGAIVIAVAPTARSMTMMQAKKVPMSTKHLVLSLLDVEPASGYDLAFRCMDSLGPIWSATHSQIYTTLHKLLKEDLVSSEDEGCDGGRKRVVYSITDSGRAELDSWRKAPLAYLPPRDPLLFWAQHLDTIPLEIIHERLDAHEDRARAELELALGKAAEIREGRNDVLERRQGRMTDGEILRARTSRGAIYDELARTAHLELERVGRLRLVAERIHDIDTK